MKKLILMIVVIIVFTACKSKHDISFKEVGYAKYPSKVRIKTFNVVINGNVSKKEILESIYRHGKDQQQTPGRMTSSFYYLNGNAPYVDQSLSVERIDSIVFDYNVFDYAVYKYPNQNATPVILDSNCNNPYEVK